MARTIQPERMETAADDDVVHNLRDLARINRWLGGNRALASVLDPYLAVNPDALVLDVGAADGQTIRWLSRRYPRARFIAFDQAQRFLRRSVGLRIAGDVFAWPLRPKSIDIVISSLFLHHFPDEQVRQILAAWEEAARIAVVAVDLHRHPLAAGFLPATRWLAGWHPITVSDGVVSVQAAFTPAELRRLSPRARVRYHWPWFRLSLDLRVNRLR